MKWVYERALEQAEKIGISGVTYIYMLTLGIIKKIILAVARSTSTIISAVCVNEAMRCFHFGLRA